LSSRFVVVELTSNKHVELSQANLFLFYKN